jgi:hypothetical protein
MGSQKHARHTTFDKALKGLIRKWRRNQFVKKIVLGEAKSFRHGCTPGTIKWFDLTSDGAVVEVSDNRGSRTIRLVYDQQHRG